MKKAGKSEDYGNLVSAKDTGILNSTDLPDSQETPDTEITQVGNALWNYKECGRINNISVQESDRYLMIDREDLLYAAFTLDSKPKSMVLWLSPDLPDETEKYTKLLQEVADGRVIIAEETSQYDSEKHAFMVWIKYNEVRYVLHKRFEYLRDEGTNV